MIGKNKGGFTVLRSVTIASEAGMVGAVLDMAIADVKNKYTQGISGAISAFGGPKKKCMKDIDTVAEIINSMGL